MNFFACTSKAGPASDMLVEPAKEFYLKKISIQILLLFKLVQASKVDKMNDG